MALALVARAVRRRARLYRRSGEEELVVFAHA